MPAPKKNKYAAKEESEKLSSTVFVNVTAEEKAAIVKAAGGRKVSEWARKILLDKITL